MNHFQTLEALRQLLMDIDEFLLVYTGNTTVRYPIEMQYRALSLESRVSHIMDELENL
jgi:hypothetical protein